MTKVTIDKSGHIRIYLGKCRDLRAMNNELFIVNAREDHIVLSPSRNTDYEVIEELNSQGDSLLTKMNGEKQA